MILNTQLQTVKVRKAALCRLGLAMHQEIIGKNNRAVTAKTNPTTPFQINAKKPNRHFIAQI